MGFSISMRKLRTELGMTQEKFAEVLHCTRCMINNYERGRSYPNIKKICIMSKLARENDIPFKIDDFLKEPLSR